MIDMKNALPEISWATVREIADHPHVLGGYASPEFDELGDDGRLWVKAVVEVAFAVAELSASRTATGTYPVGITMTDHIAHDMRLGRFPEQSSIDQFLQERAAYAAALSEGTSHE